MTINDEPFDTKNSDIVRDRWRNPNNLQNVRSVEPIRGPLSLADHKIFQIPSHYVTMTLLSSRKVFLFGSSLITRQFLQKDLKNRRKLFNRDNLEILFNVRFSEWKFLIGTLPFLAVFLYNNSYNVFFIWNWWNFTSSLNRTRKYKLRILTSTRLHFTTNSVPKG